MTADARSFLESIAGYSDAPETEVASQDKPVKLGTVDALYAGVGNPKVLFDGESLMGVRTYPWVGHRPRALERVVLLPQGHTYIILGAVGALPGSDAPVGSLLEGLWTTAPIGYTMLDGGILTRADFPALFTLLGTTYNTGGETSLQFRKPDFRGHTTAGKTDAGTFATLGAKVGAETVTHAHVLSDLGQAQVTIGAGASGGPLVRRVTTPTYSTTQKGVLSSTSTVESVSTGAALAGATNSASPSVVQPTAIVNRAVKY